MNAQLTSNHLTETQLYSLLDHDSPEAEQHLGECPTCRTEYQTLQDSLANFRLAAESMSFHLAPVRPPAIPTRARFFPMPQTAWAAGLVAAMALCVTSLSVVCKPAAPAFPVVAASPIAAHPSAQSDDALLEGIDQDLSTSVPPSLAPLDVTSSSAQSTSTTNN
jgi:predicted anti-sigma-YlaC factor YlaD